MSVPPTRLDTAIETTGASFPISETTKPEYRFDQIDEFKGRWDALKILSPDRLSEMRKVATIESVGSSARIEGVCPLRLA